MESLAQIREEARRERLLDMEERVRPYRAACFVILAMAFTVGPQVGWWWVVPLGLGLLGFAVADRFMRASERPWIWVAAAWGALPIMLAAAVVAHRRPGQPGAGLVRASGRHPGGPLRAPGDGRRDRLHPAVFLVSAGRPRSRGRR